MKRRKAPILLVSFLVLLVAGGVGYGLYVNAPQKPEMPELQNQPHESPSADDVSKQVQGSMKTAGATKGAHMLPQDATDGPSIAINAAPTMPKPKPNPSGSTASHWYDNGH